MNPGLTISLIDAIPIGALVLGCILERAFVHKSFKDEARKTLESMREGYREAA